MDGLDVGPDNVRVASAGFGDIAHIDFKLNTYDNVNDVQDAIANLRDVVFI